MIALALELSTIHNSVAVFEDERVVAEKHWSERSARSQHLFHSLPALLSEAGVGADRVDTFIVGRGPGSYSGLRIAITTARALALPGQRTVFALSSGEALAFETAEREQAQTIAVVGDARRHMLWVGVFRAHGLQLEALKPWTVIPVADLPAALREPCVVVTPDWHKLEAVAQATPVPGVRWIPETRAPSARSVGRLGLLKLGAKQPSEPLTPIYTHPPVAKLKADPSAQP